MTLFTETRTKYSINSFIFEGKGTLIEPNGDLSRWSALCCVSSGNKFISESKKKDLYHT